MSTTVDTVANVAAPAAAAPSLFQRAFNPTTVKVLAVVTATLAVIGAGFYYGLPTATLAVAASVPTAVAGLVVLAQLAWNKYKNSRNQQAAVEAPVEQPTVSAVAAAPAAAVSIANPAVDVSAAAPAVAAPTVPAASNRSMLDVLLGREAAAAAPATPPAAKASAEATPAVAAPAKA